MPLCQRGLLGLEGYVSYSAIALLRRKEKSTLAGMGYVRPCMDQWRPGLLSMHSNANAATATLVEELPCKRA